MERNSIITLLAALLMGTPALAQSEGGLITELGVE
jgi:hypothetical protein